MGSIWLEAEYNRTLSFFGGQALDVPSFSRLGGGLLASHRYQLVSLGASGDLGSRVEMKLRVAGSWTGISKGLIGLLRLNYRITPRVTLYTAAELYGQNLNNFPGTPTSRHLFHGGLELSLHKRRAVFGAGSRALPAPIPIQTSGNNEKE